jgi:hypothetical protein
MARGECCAGCANAVKARDGRERPSQAFGVKPARVAARKAATETQYRGEAEPSRMHLTCIRAAERAYTEVRPGFYGETGMRSRKVLWLGEGPKSRSTGPVCAILGRLFFGYFLLAKQKKVACVCCTGRYEFRGSAGCAGAMSTTRKYKFIHRQPRAARTEPETRDPRYRGVTAPFVGQPATSNTHYIDNRARRALQLVQRSCARRTLRA